MNRLSRDYLGYTFLILLLGWGTCVICSWIGISLKDNKLLYVPFLLGGWSPTIASFLALKKHNRVTGIKNWLGNIFDFRHGLFAYVMPVVFAAAFILPQCVISGFEKGAPFFAIIFMAPMMLLGGGLEEAGWRYILQPELEEKHSFALSAIMVSLIWWIWHLPLFHIEGASQYGQNYFAFGINVLGLSFALAAIRKKTGSVWLCVFFHCIVNSLSGIYLIHDNIWGNVAATALLILCSFVSLKIEKGQKAI